MIERVRAGVNISTKKKFYNAVSVIHITLHIRHLDTELSSPSILAFAGLLLSVIFISLSEVLQN